ncbi:MAG: hypothetical protein LBV53_02925 [Mycoplasmataceae bacterium]|nr:hypothetical protein [Mycoplasmataceae bacterium]
MKCIEKLLEIFKNEPSVDVNWIDSETKEVCNIDAKELQELIFELIKQFKVAKGLVKKASSGFEVMTNAKGQYKLVDIIDEETHSVVIVDDITKDEHDFIKVLKKEDQD